MITPCAKVALVLKLSSHISTPFCAQFDGVLDPEPWRASITDPSVSKTTPTGVVVAVGVTSLGAAKVNTSGAAAPACTFPPFTSSASAPASFNCTAAVGTAFHTAAAASTIALACALESVPRLPWSSEYFTWPPAQITGCPSTPGSKYVTPATYLGPPAITGAMLNEKRKKRTMAGSRKTVRKEE